MKPFMSGLLGIEKSNQSSILPSRAEGASRREKPVAVNTKRNSSAIARR